MIILRNKFIRIPFNQESINKYKSKENLLRHARYTKGLTEGIFLIDKQDKLVGYISWEKDFIIALEVSKEYRNKGIATELLDQALKEGARRLSVNKKNIKAINLYNSLGWKVYKEDENMLYMENKSTKYFSDREIVPYSIAKEGKKSGVIQKDKEGKWRIISYKTNPPEFWDAHYKTKNDAEKALGAYHSNK